jgi:hypothetical protein
VIGANVKVVMKTITTVILKISNWSVGRPDLNPVEYLWYHLKSIMREMKLVASYFDARNKCDSSLDDKFSAIFIDFI